jgi:hypothetical protein
LIASSDGDSLLKEPLNVNQLSVDLPGIPVGCFGGGFLSPVSCSVRYCRGEMPYSRLKARKKPE